MTETRHDLEDPCPEPPAPRKGFRLGRARQAAALAGRAGDAELDSVEPAQALDNGLSGSSWLRVLLLFVLGLIVGAVLFLPQRSLWTKTLNRLNTSGTMFTWERLDKSGLFGARLKNADLKLGNIKLHFSEIVISPGLFKPVAVRAETGNEALEMSISWSKRLIVSGKADNRILLGTDKASGAGELDVDLRFSNWTDIPNQGHVNISGLDMVLPDNTLIGNLRLKLSGNGQIVRIEQLAMDKPYPIQGSGSVQLNGADTKASVFSINGTVQAGQQVKNFNKVGTLADLASANGLSMFLN